MTSTKRSHDDDKEDGATTPPTKTLKQTTISDEDDKIHAGSTADGADAEASSAQVNTSMASVRDITPETSDAKDTDMKEQIASPGKKKRGRAEDEDALDEEEKSGDDVVPTVNGLVNGERSVRPKRARDTSVPPPTLSEETAGFKTSDTQADNTSSAIASKSETSDTSSTDSKPVFGASLNDKTQTSASAFASSGFGALSTAPSGFAALAGKPSVFGGAAPKPLGFGALTSSKPTESVAPAPKLSFALAGTSSGFGGGAVKTGFGGGFGSGFAAPVGGKLSSFAAPAASSVISDAGKPTKAFGAPDSDADDDSEDDDSGNEERSDDETSVAAGDKEKKAKLSKVPVDDGEAGEATLFSFRSKIFAIESKEKGWKERGVGTLKLNVPRSYVEFDDEGIPILGSYDPSGREDEAEGSPEPVAARLIMRQENTHRVILNTPIIKALKFEDKQGSGGGMQILFTAFEEGKPINMLLRMSEVNARMFTSEIGLIQREL